MTIIELRNKYPNAKLYFKNVDYEPHWHEEVIDYHVTQHVIVDEEYEGGKYIETWINIYMKKQA